MSSAANDKRGKLEEEFRNRMYDAESSPSQHLWSRIDHSLTVQESGEYKKRMVFYRQLAAACVALLILAGGAGAYYFGGTPATQQPLATVSPAPAATVAPASSDKTAQQAEATAMAAAKGATVAEPAAETPVGASRQPIAHSGSALANALLTVPQREKSAIPAAETGIMPVPLDEAGSGTLAVSSLTIAAARATSARPGAAESPLRLYKSISRTLAMMAGSPGAAALGSGTPGRQTMAGSTPVPGAPDDFKTQNAQAMARARQQEEEQKALALARSEAVAAAAVPKKSEKEEGREKGRWSLGMAYAPSYFEQNIGIPNQMVSASSRQSFSLADPSTTAMSSLYIDQAREEYEENTDPGFSYGVEVKAGFRLGKKLKLLTGLGFLQNTARSKSSYTIQQFWGNTFSGTYSNTNGPSNIFVPSISPEFATDSLVVAKTPEYKVNYRYRNLTVPVGLQYEGNMGKDWFWYGGAGVAVNILLQTTVLASASDVKDVKYDVNENSPFRKLQWSGNVSAGVGKRLANSVSVTLGPQVRHYFSTLLADPESTQASQGKPYTIGLNMALNYDLGGAKKSR